MQQDGEKKLARATRKDKGRPRWTERDDYCLWWVGEQRAVRYDQLRLLLARESDHETASPGWLSASRTIQTIQRWQKGGLAHYIQPYARRPGFVYLSRKGLRFAELDYRYSEPRESQLTHLSYINQARLKLEEEYDDEDGEWISERAILAEQERRTPGQRLQHVPDGIFAFANGTALELEVELSRKPREKLCAIMRGGEYLAETRNPVRYYVSPDAKAGVMRAYRAVMKSGDTFREFIDIRDLKELEEK